MAQLTNHHRNHMGLFKLGVVLFVLFVLAMLPVSNSHAEGPGHLVYFVDPNCAACQHMHRDVLEPLMAEYGQRLVVAERNTSMGANLEEWAAYYLAETGPTIHMAYFYQVGCDVCERAQQDLEYIESKYPQVQIRRLNIQEEAPLNQYLSERAGVPEQLHLTAPSLFVGDGYLLGTDVRAPAIEAMIAPYLSSGSPEPWAGWEANKNRGEAAILERFRSFGLLTVAGAGLIDGVNPCAFATLIFLIAYLSAYERKGKEILAAGLAFALGVFITYVGVGFGFLRFLAALPFLSVISKWLYGVTMVVCLVLAWGSIADYLKARAGRAQEMTLRLPDRFRNLTKRWIRKGASAQRFVPISFVLGFAVSIVELACTGQVYLPTIIFVLGIPAWRTRAGLALLLYNIMFIIPLIVVFLLVYFGTTSDQLMGWLTKRTAAIKLGTATLFIVLAGWLGYSLLAM